MHKAFLFAAASVLLAPAAQAADCEPATVPLGVFNAAKAASDGGWTRAQTFALTQSYKSPGFTLPLQAAFNNLLTNTKCNKRQIKPLGTIRSADLTLPKGEAAEIIALHLWPGADRQKGYGAFVQQGAEGQRKLALLAGTSSTGEGWTRQVLNPEFAEAWKLSNLANNYAPFRKVLQARYEYVQAIKNDDDLAKRERQMLFNTAEKLDQYMAGTVPDYLYLWVKPF